MDNKLQREPPSPAGNGERNTNMATMPATFIGSDTWNIDVHGTISFAARLSGAIKSRRATLQLALFTWRLNKKLADFFDTIHGKMQARADGTTSGPEAADPEVVQNAINALVTLHGVLNRICVITKQAGLLNHSSLAPGLMRLRSHDERVVELKEWLEDMLHPEQLEALFASAQEEFERGETVTIVD